MKTLFVVNRELNINAIKEMCFHTFGIYCYIYLTICKTREEIFEENRNTGYGIEKDLINHLIDLAIEKGWLQEIGDDE